MATSSIFAQVKISGSDNIERFIQALEESEEAQKNKKSVPSGVRILRDKGEIHKLISMRYPKK